MFIPPENINFRLLGYESHKYLFSRYSQNPTFFHHGTGPCDDQWWHLIHGKGDRAGSYAFKSNYTGRVIYSRTHKEPKVGVIDSDGAHADNWFKFEPGKGKLESYFRLRNVYSNTVLVSRSTGDPTLWNHPADSKTCEDQYFTFLFEDMKISRIVYESNEANILSQKPEVIGSATQRNHTSINQQMEFSFSETKTTSSSFNYTYGYAITIGASGKVGIPLVAEGEVKVETTQSHEFSWGLETTNSKVFETKFTVVAPPKSKITATGKVTRADVDVPFTVHFKSIATGHEVAIDGTYKGVTFWDIDCDYKQDALE